MRKTLIYLVSTVMFDTAIAGVLTMLVPSIPFRLEFIYSQCVGLSVMSINLWVVTYATNRLLRWVAMSISLPSSVALGLTLAFAISGVGSWGDEKVWQSMVIGLFFGLIGGITLLLSEQIEMEVSRQQLVKAESKRREVEANLKMLQAQIEPHFLFNTLANVSSLIDTDPTLAKGLLARLNDWLRVALLRARSDHTTLGDELDMLENYLQILRIRFGERLHWRIDVPEDARRSIFPPMLLQPLVENAVRHGIEPKLGGGEIAIAAHSEEGTLRISVRDSGVGLQGNADGAGLANVHARLATLFGDAGRLRLANHADGGVIATLELPVQESMS